MYRVDIGGVHRVEIFRIRKEGVCAERKGVC